MIRPLENIRFVTTDSEEPCAGNDTQREGDGRRIRGQKRNPKGGTIRVGDSRVIQGFSAPPVLQWILQVNHDSKARRKGVQNPVIQSSVRSITLTENSDKWGPKFTEWMNGTSLLAILRLSFYHLESFSITEHRRSHHWSWDSFSVELKDAISNIIHSPTLKTLFLKGITKVLTTFFLHIGHLTTLRLQSISPIDFCDDSSLTRAASKGKAWERHQWHSASD
jgi:hypothetical protein